MPTAKVMVVVKHTFLELSDVDVPAPLVLGVPGYQGRARADSDSVIDYGIGLDYVSMNSMQVLYPLEENALMMSGTCRKGHCLRKHDLTHGEVYWCATCVRNRIEAPEWLMRCEQCNFDLCMRCAGQTWMFDANTCAGSSEGFSPRGSYWSDSAESGTGAYHPIMAALHLCDPSQSIDIDIREDSSSEEPEEGMVRAMIRDTTCLPPGVWAPLSSTHDMDLWDSNVRAKTTVIVKDIPEDFTRDTLVALLDGRGFACTFDFVYMPHNFRTQKNFGYIFINFVTVDMAAPFLAHFADFKEWGIPSEKLAKVSYTDKIQGLEANIEHYRDNPAMHQCIPDAFKPALYCDGQRMTFPAPTRALKAPRASLRLFGDPRASFRPIGDV